MNGISEQKYNKRTIGDAKLGFKIVPGAFGAAYIQGWLSADNRQESFNAFATLQYACNGLNTGGWVDDKGTHCPFEVRVERGICSRHLNRTCSCDASNPFKIAAKMVTQRNLNRAYLR